MQVCRRDPTAIVITRDSDLIAYGCKIVVMIDNYAREEFRIIRMDTIISPDVKDNFKLYVAYQKFGIKIIHWWAAVMGSSFVCDV